MSREDKPLFELGKLVATPNALDALQRAGQQPSQLLRRHVTGDWGDLDAKDNEANDQAITDGSRIFSAYTLETGQKVWVITESDRSSTCLLLPEDY